MIVASLAKSVLFTMIGSPPQARYSVWLALALWSGSVFSDATARDVVDAIAEQRKTAIYMFAADACKYTVPDKSQRVAVALQTDKPYAAVQVFFPGRQVHLREALHPKLRLTLVRCDDGAESYAQQTARLLLAIAKVPALKDPANPKQPIQSGTELLVKKAFSSHGPRIRIGSGCQPEKGGYQCRLTISDDHETLEIIGKYTKDLQTITEPLVLIYKH